MVAWHEVPGIAYGLQAWEGVPNRVALQLQGEFAVFIFPRPEGLGCSVRPSGDRCKAQLMVSRLRSPSGFS